MTLQMEKAKSILRVIEWEAVFWLAGLIYLFFIDPYQTQQFTICPFHNAGITFCPGCGVGRSISFFYHGEFLSSLRTHPLGIVVLAFLTVRIVKLSIKTINNYHKSREVIYG